MIIELKNVKHFPSLSQEMETFKASLYINGKQAGYAENTGHGGETNYFEKDAKGKELKKKAEEFARSSTKYICITKSYFIFSISGGHTTNIMRSSQVLSSNLLRLG